MKSFTLALAVAGLAHALPSAHGGRRHEHQHHRRSAEAAPDVKYDTSNVDWQSFDWKKILDPNNNQPTVAQTAAQPAAQPAAKAAVALGNVAAPAAVIPPPAASVPAKSSGGKRGIAWDPITSSSLAPLFQTGAASWTYNWGMTPSFSSAMQYVYHVRTVGQLGELGNLPKNAVVLGFNEPDQEGMSVGEAVGHYRSTLQPLRKSGAIGTLASPGITNGNSGLPWLKQFIAACGADACGVDKLQVHFYGPTLDMLTSQIGAIHAAFPNMEIWVTEVGCTNWDPATNPSPAQVAAFMAGAISFFESTPYIGRYSFFSAGYITDPALGTANSQLTGAGAGSALTALGKQYTS